MNLISFQFFSHLFIKKNQVHPRRSQFSRSSEANRMSTPFLGAKPFSCDLSAVNNRTGGLFSPLKNGPFFNPRYIGLEDKHGYQTTSKNIFRRSMGSTRCQAYGTAYGARCDSMWITFGSMYYFYIS